ncbi:ATP-binding protein [Streptomyces sp. NPDC050804]|uniref:ATP-binding protein n=1 Tax=Streptomyces sp. NPDC050804 TaxID=3154745 RepID=UPI0034424F9B
MTTATSQVVSTTRSFSGGASVLSGTILSGVELNVERATQPGQKLAERDKLWPGRLRLLGRAHLRRWGLSDFVGIADLLLTELVTNAFQHGEGNEIGVRILRTKETIGIEVTDGSSRHPIARQVLLLEESGRGIHIVAEIADAWGVSEDGTCTWCVIRTSNAESKL